MDGIPRERCEGEIKGKASQRRALCERKERIVHNSVYIRRKDGNIEIITIWVDDLLLFTNATDMMTLLKWELQTLFEVTNMGEPSKIVGIEIKCDCEHKTLKIMQK